MTKHEKLILTAYTGILMVQVEEFRAWLSENNYPDPLMKITKEGVTLAFEDLKKKVENEFYKIIYTEDEPKSC